MFSKILPKKFPPAKNPLLLAKQNEIRQLQLKPFKRIHFKFDPFHSQVVSIREFLQHLDRRQVHKTNPKCLIRTEIVCDQQEPTITAHLEKMQNRHYNVLVEMYDMVYNLFPEFDQLFDEETFYLVACGLTIISVAICFILSRFIHLREANI
ncbi:hypothetical protein DERP_000707 [Dermatophagoides pteronyssinus]|uniref:Large ribosomal subunit protein mL53 n=1 Tax=Dermatophagoides pteronyssinus TaxID=6956 RepID=A0ABQ8J0Z1_DERPT|nr:hypothetical protein DERP_000707 [Dermatophagoides pteronyssinus]